MPKSPKVGKSKSGAGSRGTSRGADGRGTVVIGAVNFDASELGSLNLSPGAYSAIKNSDGSVEAFAQRDGSIYVRIPGYGKLEQGTASEKVMAEARKNAAPYKEAVFKRDATGKLVKQPKEGVIIR